MQFWIFLFLFQYLYLLRFVDIFMFGSTVSGEEGLGVGGVCEECGMRSPQLYKHYCKYGKCGKIVTSHNMK